MFFAVLDSPFSVMSIVRLSHHAVSAMSWQRSLQPNMPATRLPIAALCLHPFAFESTTSADTVYFCTGTLGPSPLLSFIPLLFLIRFPHAIVPSLPCLASSRLPTRLGLRCSLRSRTHLPTSQIKPTRSSSFSPNPKIPPLHTLIPASLTACNVASRSSYVRVVMTDG